MLTVSDAAGGASCNGRVLDLFTVLWFYLSAVTHAHTSPPRDGEERGAVKQQGERDPSVRFSPPAALCSM
ncbi:unnamed protein product [Arctogadus glacialis]